MPIVPWNSNSWLQGRPYPLDYRYNATLNQVGLNLLQRPALNRPYNSQVYPISGFPGGSTTGQPAALNRRPYSGIVNWQWLFGPQPAIKNNPVVIPYGPNPLGMLGGNIIG